MAISKVTPFSISLGRAVHRIGRAASSHNLRQSPKGQATLEFALTMLVFLWILVGLFDLGRGTIAYVNIANMAGEAARYGAAHYSTEDLTWIDQTKQVARKNARTLDESRLVVDVTSQAAKNVTYVKVQINYTFRPVTPLAETMMGSRLDMATSTTVVAR